MSDLPTLRDDEDTSPTLEAVRTEFADRPRSVQVVDWAAASTVGLVRESNEDVWGQRGDVYVVADGMGGLPGGELAASVAVEAFLDAAADVPSVDWDADLKAVDEAVRLAGERAGFDRVGTTLVAAVVVPDRVVIVNVGDSRVFRWRDGNLGQLTQDHTVRRELLDAGLHEGFAGGSQRWLNGLTSFVGGADDLRVDVSTVAIREGDRLLLCSDGVYRQVSASRMSSVLETMRAQEACQKLIHVADAAGGVDNATALILQFGIDRGAE